MSNPRDRLYAVLGTYTPSEVKFKPNISKHGHLEFTSYLIKKMNRATPVEDIALHEAFLARQSVYENWDHNTQKFHIPVTVSNLFDVVKRSVTEEYDCVSTRCHATRRKTQDFIRSINLDNKHLANYLLQVFTTINSEEYEQKSKAERAQVLEPLEALRRTYGKR